MDVKMLNTCMRQGLAVEYGGHTYRVNAITCRAYTLIDKPLIPPQYEAELYDGKSNSVLIAAPEAIHVRELPTATADRVTWRHANRHKDKELTPREACQRAAVEIAKYLDSQDDEPHLLTAAWYLLCAVRREEADEQKEKTRADAETSNAGNPINH